jgi:small-conductance mechanosensitive channel
MCRRFMYNGFRDGRRTRCAKHRAPAPRLARRVLIRLLKYFLLFLAAFGPDSAVAQDGSRGSDKPAEEARSAGPAQPGQRAPEEPVSEAERISRLQRAIDEDSRRLAELKTRLEDPQSEFAKAEAEFQKLDAELEEQTRQLDRLRWAGRHDEADALEPSLEKLRERRQLSKDRFDLAIQERRALREQIGTLEQKVARDREALQKILTPPEPTTQPATEPRAPAAPAPPPEQPEKEPPAAAHSVEPPSQPLPVGAAPGGEAAPAAQPQPQLQSPAAAPTKEVAEAQAEVAVRREAAQEAEKQVRSITERMEAIQRAIELERKLLITAQRRADNAEETQRTLTEQAQKASIEGAPRAELRDLWGQIAEARRRVREAEEAVGAHQERIDELQQQLQQLQAEQIGVLQEAERSRRAVEQAQRRLEGITNPLAPRNLLKWAIERGPKVLGILLGMFVLSWLSRIFQGRIARLIAARAERGSEEDRANRARTLVHVFHSAVSVVIIVGGCLLILQEFDVDIVPLLGGAAVVGLAVAFGAQNLMRDYFSGFMILLENQYGINDVVKIGNLAGLVERITLRITVLRDLEGVVHFIPNGQITAVSNMTHGWSRALFDIPVSYRENVHRVMDVLMKLARELRADSTFRQMILEEPEMLGVERFDDSAVVIRFLIKTRPLKQWTVRRALLGRIKAKFDELGIEIPFPHRTVYHRWEDGAPQALMPAANAEYRMANSE